MPGLEEVEISYCMCIPLPIHLMGRGLFACSPIAPTLAVDLRVLEFVKMLFVRLTPNTTAWCDALENFLNAQGYKLQSKVCSLNSFTIFFLHPKYAALAPLPPLYFPVQPLSLVS